MRGQNDGVVTGCRVFVKARHFAEFRADMASKYGKPEIYFHVGLGKTASTWLQNKVFSHFQGITYLHPTRYRHWRSAIEQNTTGKVLISREMDQQLEREISHFAAVYPDTHAIIVIRSNAQWMASQYRRFLKNGYPLTFYEFFDVEGDTGFWKRSDAYLYPKIEILKKYFTQPPIVLLYDALRNDPIQFVAQFATAMGVHYDAQQISADKHHTSYSEKQLKWMLIVAKRIFGIPKNDPTQPRWKIWVRRRPRMWLCYVILYSAWLVPSCLLSAHPLIDPAELEKIQRFYAEDWQKCVTAAERRSS